MRYFMTIAIAPEYDSGAKEVPQSLMDAMGPYMDQAISSGALISTGGLKRSRDASRLTGDGGRIAVTDGPFAETRELVGGYAVFEAPDKETALGYAREFLQLHIDHGLSDITLEVREIEGGYNY